jgi:hypothetical protein
MLAAVARKDYEDRRNIPASCPGRTLTRTESKNAICLLLIRVVAAIDPAVSSSENNDETGIIVAGLGRGRYAGRCMCRTGRYHA